ncbi:AMIN domain-containing protein [Calothrix sp. PCC 7507]|uniref:AMIN domain-containing protein n=1 Tax=Calothrix sp. PCC 7507 TaxID=99598 RepID=UPI00029EF483|nr:AMIN domain-containing protein [Calothrix sp. PCC 7507]AFY33962.1 hypothetical protein Cal7507_3570 [Calothrix sp. PCC 7507]
MNQELKPRSFSQICKRLFGISLLSLYAAIALEPGISTAKPSLNKSPIQNRPTSQLPTVKNVVAPVARLDNWRFYPEAIQLEFTISAGITPRHFYLAQPPRIVVDLPDTKLGYVPTQQNYSGAIQRIRVSQLNSGITRIVMDLAPGNFSEPNQIKLQLVSKQNPTRWVLRPLIRGYTNSLQPGNYPQTPSNLPPSPYNQPQTPSINPPPSPYNYPQTPSNLPPSSYNYPQPPNSQSPTTQQPFVTVPPLTPNSSSQPSSSILPPPNFPNQPGNFNNPQPIASPNLSVPVVPNYPSNVPNTRVIEFGQPLPRTR